MVALVPLTGQDTAPEFFIDGIASIRFMGVNTRYVLFKNIINGRGIAVRKVEFTVIMPTGALPRVLGQLIGFAREHHMEPVHDATR